MLDSQRQDIAAGTLKAGDDRNAEWIGALEGARWPKPDARSVCRAARRFAHGAVVCLRKPERSAELVDGDGWDRAARTPRTSPDAPPTMRLAPTMATKGAPTTSASGGSRSRRRQSQSPSRVSALVGVHAEVICWPHAFVVALSSD